MTANEKNTEANTTTYVEVLTPKATNQVQERPANEINESAPKEVQRLASFRELFQFADKLDYLLMFIGTIGAFLTGLSQPIQIILYGDVIDAFNPNTVQTEETIMDAITGASLNFVYVGIGTLFAGFLQVACWSITASRQIKRIRYAYISAIMRQDIGWFDVTNPLTLATKVVDASIVIQDGMGRKVGDGLNFFSQCVCGIIIALVKGWKLALVMMAITPLIAASGYFMTKVLSTAVKKRIEAYAVAGGIAEEALGNIRTVHMFNSITAFAAKYSKALAETQAAGIKRAISVGFGTGLMFFFVLCTYGAGMYYGAYLVSKDVLSDTPCTGSGCYTGDRVLIVFFSVIFGAFAIGQAGPSIQAIFSGRAAAFDAFQLIHRKSLVDPLDESGKKPEKILGKIELKNVNFHYPTRPDVQVCKNYSLSIEAGEKIALVGPSGSGKSTIVSLLERYYIPQSGEIYLDGYDIKDLNVAWLRRQFGLVGQEPSLFATSITENIRYGKPSATMDEIIEAAKMANAYNFIMRFPAGFDTEVGANGTQLSGGQKQRIAIARAIIRNPPILLLDEATSALDTESEKIVQKSLDQLVQATKRTTIIIAHRLSTIRDVDRIIVHNKGSIVEVGNHDALMNIPNGHYRKLVEAQSLSSSSKEKDGGFEVVVSDETVTSTKSDESVTIKVPETIATVEPEAGKEEIEEEIYNVPAKRIWKLSAPDWIHFIPGGLGAVINASIYPVWGILLTKITVLLFNYSLTESEMRDDAMWWSLAFVLLGVLFGVSIIVKNYSFGIIGERLTTRIRDMGFRSMLRQEIGWFDLDENSSGALTSKLASDSAIVQANTSEFLNQTLVNLVTLGLAFGVSFYNSWQMTLAVLAVFPVLGFSFYIQTQLMHGDTNKEANEDDTKAGSLISESINSIRTVASFGMETGIQHVYQLFLAQSKVKDKKQGLFAGIGFGFAQGSLFFVLAFLFWLGGKLVTKNKINFEQMFIVMMAIIFSTFGLGMSAQSATDTSVAKKAVSRIFKIIDRVPKIDALSESGIIPTRVEGEIELKNIKFAYPARADTLIYKNYSLRIQAGQTVALVGPSGSGKSTAISLIERFYDPMEGQIFLDQIDLCKINLRWLRDHISLVSQEPVLFSGTIADNIGMGKENATREEIIEAAKKANAHQFISLFPDGYDTNVGTRGTQVSGGQKQRIAIARAILRDPVVLLLDEATSALDSESEKIVQASLDSLMQLKKRTTIVIAHRLSTIKNADQIAVTDQGGIVELGTHDELLQIPNGIYKKLVNQQSLNAH